MQKKQIIELNVTGILIFILIFAVIRGVKKTGDARRSKNKEIVFTPLAKEGSAKERLFQDETHSGETFEKLREESKNLELKTDPFSGAPIVPEKAPSSGGVSLNGILWDENGPLAIINNDVVKAGDRIGGYVVVEIKKEVVILDDGTHKLELRL